MICSELRRDLGFFCRSFVGFLDRSVSSAMVCFFDCFKVRDDRNRSRAYLVPDSPSLKQRDTVVSRNRLSSLFLAEEIEDSPSKDTDNKSFGSPRYTKELKNEAKFLKACGTIAETPTEIRKAFKKISGSPDDDHLDLPHTPIKLSEEQGKEFGSAERTPSSCTTSEQNVQRIFGDSIEFSDIGSVITTANAHESPPGDTVTKVPPWHSAADIQCRSKSVRFECDINESPTRSSSQILSEKMKESESSGDRSGSKPSPYPTPLQLSDEMQTPGTVYPANLDVLTNGKARIRSQYVYSVLNPVESASQLKALEEGDSYSERFSGEMRGFAEESEDFTPISKRDVKASTREKDLMVEASLSAWLKPVASHELGGVNRPNRVGIRAGDRPIIGMVAAHWNEEEPAQISPKEWDGNGIPNSTNKYKEDQKVSWHATPFEERLEKALSEESIVTRKNWQGKLVTFDEEDDTALSRLQSSVQPSSVVSF